MRLSPEEARVTGSLIEKELTTPQQYPLTQNALLLACNQSSNRDPVVDYNERTVDSALAALKTAGLVRYVHPSHGRSVTRYQHLLGDQLGLNGPQLALVAVLMLRGPQTAGELRSRTERMCEFDGISDVELELELLNTLPEPLVARLARRPGQKEERWVQLLTGPSAVPVVPEGPSEPGGAATGQAGDSGPGARVTSGLAAQVAELRAELSELRDQLEALRQDFWSRFDR